jgi:hypothetical protein
MSYTDQYIVVRMWCPPEETSTPSKAKYVRRLELEGGGTSWTLTEDWKEANFFSSARVAGRIVVGVDRLRTRISRGWAYEIVKVTEVVLSSNLEDEIINTEEEVA